MKGWKKSLALKDKKESSDEECSTSGSEDEEYAMAVRDFTQERCTENCSWSDSGEEDDEKVKNETCLVAQALTKEIRSRKYAPHSLTSKELVRNLPKLKFDQHFCDACKIGKQAYANHKAKNIVSTTRCLELFHMDLFGPSAVRSYGENRYTLVKIDEYSSTWSRGPPCCKPDTQHCKILCDVVYIFYTVKVVVTIILIVVIVAIMVVVFVVAIIGVVVVVGGVSSIIKLLFVIIEKTKTKSSIEEPLELELKELPSHLEYAFLEETDKLPAIAWKISDIKGIDPRFCTHKILMEEDYKLAVQSQRWVNPKIHDVIKKEVIKLLDSEMIYRISDSPWTPKTKIKQLSHTLMKLSLTVACLSACIDHRAKVDVIAKLPHPTTVKGVRSFLGHVECVNAFDTLKKKLTEALILVVPDWNLPFELMCDASDFAIGAVLGQHKTKHFQPIHYASKTMTEAQIYYTTTEKEMIAVVYAFEKFWPYLVLSKSIVYTDLSALKYLLSKQDAKPRLLRWVLLLENCASWSDKLDDALWVFSTAFKTPIGCIPYKLVYGKSCHLPIELDHKAYWALKHVNFDLKTASDHRKL
nr:hypothetical protein [Tanacetum cinerariifolium]